MEREGKDLRRLRRRLQIIFQDPVGSLNPRMPVSDIIGEGLIAQADDENGWSKASVREARIGEYLEAVGLRKDYARRFPHEFSGGQRQRIGIARALVLEPDFIVCDEPVSALDVSIQSQILNLLLDLRARVRPDLPVHRPQPVRGPVHQRPRRRDVPGQDRGAGHGGCPVRAPEPPVHRGAPVRGARARPPPPQAAHRAQGRPAVTRRATVRAAASTPAAGCGSSWATPSAAPPRTRSCAPRVRAPWPPATSRRRSPMRESRMRPRARPRPRSWPT